MSFIKGDFVVVQYPVYFAFEDEDIDAVLADVKRNDATGQPATATTGGLVDQILNCILRIILSRVRRNKLK